nr:protein phosphatase 2C domain-containing protein [Streptomyces sp. SHP 1-2]
MTFSGGGADPRCAPPAPPRADPPARKGSPSGASGSSRTAPEEPPPPNDGVGVGDGVGNGAAADDGPVPVPPLPVREAPGAPAPSRKGVPEDPAPSADPAGDARPRPLRETSHGLTETPGEPAAPPEENPDGDPTSLERLPEDPTPSRQGGVPRAAAPCPAPGDGPPATPVGFGAPGDLPPPLPPPPAPAPSPVPAYAAGGADRREGGVPAYVGFRPPTYEADPTALPPADPEDLGGLVPDTVLDGARYGTCTLRAVSVRGDSARYRGDPRRDALLTARFGTGDDALLLVAMATGARAAAGAHRAAAEACLLIAEAVGRSHPRLSADLRAGHRGDLRAGLHRLTDRGLGRLRARAVEQGLAPEEYTAGLRCLLLPADPGCRTRVFFGVGPGGLLRLRDGVWHDLEPRPGGSGGAPGPVSPGPGRRDRPTGEPGVPAPPAPDGPAPAGPPRAPFRFRDCLARPGDVLLLCTEGLAEPLLGEPELGALLARRWSDPGPPGLPGFLADTGVRVKGHADDRTAAALWEA